MNRVRTQDLLRELIADPTDDCIIWTRCISSSGYGLLWVAGAWQNAHRYVCKVTHGEPEGRREAAHSCGVRACVNPRHLRWATNSENNLDKRRHGTATRGDRATCRTLTSGQVREIRDRLGRGERQHVLAAEYGVTQPAISDVRTGRSWGWMP